MVTLSLLFHFLSLYSLVLQATVNPKNFIHDVSVFKLFTVFYFQILDQKMHYDTTVLYCVLYFLIFIFSPTQCN